MQKNNYVAAWYDRRDDQIIVCERDADGQRTAKVVKPKHYFYVPDSNGTFTSIYGDSLAKLEFDSLQEMEAAKSRFQTRFESDITPLKRFLMDEYYDVPAPIVNFAFLDIEVNYSKKLGFAGPRNPYAIINAITVYQSWSKEFHTVVVPPMVPNPNGDGEVPWTEIPGNSVEMLYDKINELIASKQLRSGIIPKITIVNTEFELLQMMEDLIRDADIISGWNSEFFDIPYIAERLIINFGDRGLAKLEIQAGRHRPRPPFKEMVSRFGTEEPIYKFTGRSHLDYLKLFQKFTFEGRTSYALGNILQEEVGVGKLEYDGTLEQLYHNDFPTFVAYNFRDVDGLVQLDDKFKFIALANQMAHENTVVFDAVMGTVAYVETGIANHAHNKMNRIVHDKRIGEHDKVEGAIVMSPRRGLHEWIGSVDINSLYPNTIRSLNISPEMIIGQFLDHEDAWEAIRNKSSTELSFEFEDGTVERFSGAEWSAVLADQKWAVSAYGTVFDQSKGNGVVADILGYWYSERKRLQAEKKKYGKLASEETDPVKKADYEKMEEQYDLLQLTKKISMNSLYGALLNVAFRFGDERMGASVTATGRQITTHMIQTIGTYLSKEPCKLEKRFISELGDEDETLFTDIYASNHAWEEFLKLPTKSPGGRGAVYGTKCDAIIYGDTDSCYYKTYAKNKEDAIRIADETAEAVNASFPEFMREAFNCQDGFDQLIKAGREIVGRRGLFQAKKKYMIKVVDLEGKPVDKLKSMGSEIKKADTPKIIQKFLEQTVNMLLDGISYDEIVEYVVQQRTAILRNKDNTFKLGVAKQVNNLTAYQHAYDMTDKGGAINPQTGRKITVPGHARAALNYNRLVNGWGQGADRFPGFDEGSKTISSGDKVLVYQLATNPFGMKSIGIPAEMTKFPSWMQENFKIDIKKTEQAMFDNKLGGIFAAIGKDVPTPQSVITNKILSF